MKNVKGLSKKEEEKQKERKKEIKEGRKKERERERKKEKGRKEGKERKKAHIDTEKKFHQSMHSYLSGINLFHRLDIILYFITQKTKL